MKKITSLIALVVFSFLLSAASAADFVDETLHYVISYKWGLIHKDAGTATLSLKNIGDKYHVKLTGKTKSWADNFYQVRDTLTGTIAKNGLKPEEYSKIAHEDGKYSRDDIVYSYAGSHVGELLNERRLTRKAIRPIAKKTLRPQVLRMICLAYFIFCG